MGIIENSYEARLIMSEMKAVGITAAVSSVLSVLILVGMLAPMTSFTLTPSTNNDSFWVYTGGSYTINADFETNERWVVEYSSSYSLSAYLLDDADYQDYLSYGYVNHYISYQGNANGYFDYTVSSNGIYYIVFRSPSYDTYVTATITAYHFP